MNLAVIGSGGREHAICYKLKQSPKIKKIVCVPGNSGTQEIAENIKEDISNFNALYQIIKKQNIDLVVVGPEQPLVEGLVDYLNEKKIRVFGPDKFTSQLEGSKAFMKNLKAFKRECCRRFLRLFPLRIGGPRGGDQRRRRCPPRER